MRNAADQTTEAQFQALAQFQRQDPALVLRQFSGLVVSAQYRYLYRITRTYLTGSSSVLDWGCGDGHFSHFLLTQGHAVTSYSVQDEPPLFRMLSGPEAARLRFIRANGSPAVRLPFSDASFDAAFSVGVLEHVRETGRTESESLAEIERVLRPGGHFVCFHLPNRNSYIEALCRALYGPCEGQPPEAWKYHRVRFLQQDIRCLCAESGLELVEMRRYAFLPRNILGRLPQAARDSEWLTSWVNRLDEVLEKWFSPVCQNFWFVARKCR